MRLGRKRRSPIKQGFGQVGILSGLGIGESGINRGWSAIADTFATIQTASVNPLHQNY